MLMTQADLEQLKTIIRTVFKEEQAKLEQAKPKPAPKKRTTTTTEEA